MTTLLAEILTLIKTQIVDNIFCELNWLKHKKPLLVLSSVMEMQTLSSKLYEKLDNSLRMAFRLFSVVELTSECHIVRHSLGSYINMYDEWSSLFLP